MVGWVSTLSRSSRGRASSIITGLILLLSIWTGGASAEPLSGACAGIIASDAVQKAPRPIAPLDLVRLRDIGFFTGFAKDSPIGVSPREDRIAFVITRADPVSNSYCQALVVLPLGPAAKPAVIDTGGEFISVVSSIRGNLTPTGAPAVISPKWSPDGRWIAYLKRINGSTQAWIVRDDGIERFQVTRSESDIESLAWSRDGRQLLFTTQSGIARAQRRIAAEARSGFLYDSHLVPFNGSRPSVPGPVDIDYLKVDIATRVISLALPGDRERLDPLRASDVPPGALKVVRSRDGALAWTMSRTSGRLMSVVDLWARLPGKPAIRCESATCQGRLRGIEGLWWLDRGVLFLRREGWGFSRLGLYRWYPGQTPQRLLVTDDLLMGCQLVRRQLVCASERADQPRQLMAYDTVSGRSSLLFDPNPDFRSLQLGRVERLHWRNVYGFESFGDLVLPPGHRGKKSLPLIIVQYSSRGFLRGGTGDEYPIQLFAAYGFAVLSVQAPPAFYESLPDPGWRTWQEAEVENIRGWRDRRSNLSTVLSGVDLLVRRGVVDPRRIGITGLSDGATTVQFALVNAPGVFAAASVSSCFMDPDSIRIYGGLAWYDDLKSLGYPALSHDNRAFWTEFSVAENAGRITTPLLMQVPQHEFILSLESFAKLKDAGQPVEMFVFPSEYHVKSQPAHRLAIYQRNLDWFDFWLKGERSSGASAARQYARWDALQKPIVTTPAGSH